MRTTWGLGLAVLSLTFAGACSSPPACWSTAASCTGGTSCSSDTQCDSGACVEGACATLCHASTECGGGEACVSTFDSRYCRSDCPAGAEVIDEQAARAVCDGGAVRACSALGDPTTRCDACGCGAGMTCSSSSCSESSPCTCATPEPVGGPCTTDVECASGNCSSFARTCRVAEGATCTENDCDFCQTYSDGTSYCSRLCDGSDRLCGADGICLGFSDTQHYTCFPRCTGPGDASCAGECIHPGGGSSEYFCSCSTASGCRQHEAMHAPLAPCAAYGDTFCGSGACLGHSIQGATNTFTWGYCSDACATDADCGAAGVCVNLPCAGADTPQCGLQCLPRCEGSSCYGRGVCTGLTGAAGASVMACFVAP